MSDITSSTPKIKRTLKEKLMFVVTGKYPEKKENEIPEQSLNTSEQTEKPKNKKQKQSFFDGIKELIVGKKKKINSEKNSKQEKIYQQQPIISEQKAEESKEELNVFTTEIELSAEEKFEQATKMTLQQAEKKVAIWYKNKEMDKVKQGTALILQYFPNHPLRNNPPQIDSNENSKNILQKESETINNVNSQKENIETTKSPTEKKTEPELKKNSEQELENNNKTNKETLKKENNNDEDEDFVDESLLRKMASRPWESVGIKIEQLEEEGLPQESEINDDERVFAGISYFPFLSFFVITTRKDSPFALYHAWQGFAILAIFLASLPFYFLLKFIFGISFLFWVFYMTLFGVSAFAAFMAWSGRYIKIPIISNFAKKLSGK